MKNIDVQVINKLLVKECRLSEDERVVVGVSGGPDSMCLMDLLTQTKIPIVVAHYDHGLRSVSGEDARQVETTCMRLGLPFRLGKGDVSLFSKEHKMSIEEAARECRYQFLFETARKEQAAAILVAHTADDQVETVLMHLLRGAGLSGLKGMAYRSILPEWDPLIPIIRPLLGIWREEIMTYCESHQLNPVMDASNQDTTYFRNRLRHELIPDLTQYNPQFKTVLWRMAASLMGDYELINGITQTAWDEIVSCVTGDAVCLKYSRIKTLEPGLQRNILRKALQILRPALRDINYEAIERALDFIDNPSKTKQMDLIDNLWMYLQKEQLFIAEPSAQILYAGWPSFTGAKSINLPETGELKLDGQWKLVINRIHSETPLDLIHSDPFQAWLDLTQLHQPLTVQNWKSGDWIRPYGMQGRIKLSDLFINLQVPLQARKKYPLIFSGDEIVWVPGLRLAQTAALTKDSHQILHLHLIRSEQNYSTG